MTLAFSWLGWDLPLQVLFNGGIRGLGYAVIAAGLVLIYRSSGVLNFAQAAIGAFGVNLFALVAVRYGVPYVLALGAGVAAGVAFACLTELLVVRRLFDASRVVLFIATVGVAELVLTLITLVFPDVSGEIPTAFSGSWAELDVGSLRAGARETSALLLVLPVIGVLGLFLTRTRFGLHIRGVADSPENARLVGVSPRRVSTIVWGTAGGLAAYTQIVMAPVNARTVQELSAVSSSGLLLRALLVALIARMRSFPVVLIAGMAVGAVENTIALNLNQNQGIVDLFLLIAMLVLLLAQRAGRSAGADSGFRVGAKIKPIPAHLERIWWVRHLSGFGLATLIVALGVVPPVFFDSPSELLGWSQVLLIAAIAISVSLLTGWAGQLSLGQAAFAGVGGMATIALASGHPVGVGVMGHDAFTFSVHLPWFVALLIGTLVGAVLAALIGLPALRLGGLFLAAVTLAFAAMVANWLLRQDAWNGGSPVVDRQPRPVLFGIDFATPRMYYLLCLAFLAGCVCVVAQFRRTGAGRRIIAVRDNEQMTSAVTVSPTRAKLSAFAIAGAIAAMAGGLLVYLLPGFEPAGANSPFSIDASLRVVAIAIIGGLGSIAGAILGALWVIGVPLLFPDWDAIDLLTADLGLLILLLYFPGGFVQALYNGRDLLLRRVESRRGNAPADAPVRVVANVPVRESNRPIPAAAEPWLVASDITVRFGGLAAVHSASLDVRGGEIVGLIGTNGAGKTTLMNAISGFVPASGRLRLLGTDIDHLGSPQRHRVGLGRGFQDARLFPSLTVRETVLMALEARERSRTLASLAHLPPSPASERRKRAEATDIIDYLGLGRFADLFVSELSTGTRRIVELSCLIATQARVLLLDEPTGGVAQRETEAFGPLIRRVGDELGAAMLIIEHDMPLIMSISDRVYCLEAGRVIAEGPPEQVRNDPVVIASYLGTDERAIRRSGTLAAAAPSLGFSGN